MLSLGPTTTSSSTTETAQIFFLFVTPPIFIDLKPSQSHLLMLSLLIPLQDQCDVGFGAGARLAKRGDDHWDEEDDEEWDEDEHDDYSSDYEDYDLPLYLTGFSPNRVSSACSCIITSPAAPATTTVSGVVTVTTTDMVTANPTVTATAGITVTVSGVVIVTALP
jgi:hypothetical protein